MCHRHHAGEEHSGVLPQHWPAEHLRAVPHPAAAPLFLAALPHAGAARHAGLAGPAGQPHPLCCGHPGGLPRLVCPLWVLAVVLEFIPQPQRCMLFSSCPTLTLFWPLHLALGCCMHARTEQPCLRPVMQDIHSWLVNHVTSCLILDDVE